MRRTAVAAAVAAAALVLPAASSGNAAPLGPPAGLTAYGRILWNFEALARARYGTAYVCSDNRRTGLLDYTARLCLTLANAYQDVHNPVFRNARSSQFRLTTGAPNQNVIGNVAPIMMGDEYILCAARSWLAENSLGTWVCT
jgi:hypothetical protein